MGDKLRLYDFTFRMLCRLRYIVLFSFLVAAAGCELPPQDLGEMTVQELHALIDSPTGAKSTMWEGVFYCGTDSKYHHLILCTGGSRDREVKILVESLPIVPEKKYRLKSAEWIKVTNQIKAPQVAGR